MAVFVSPGETIPNRLDVFVQDPNGFPATPFSIGFGIYKKDGATLTLISGSANEPPQSDAIGHYFTSFQIPNNATLGEYRIIWQVQMVNPGPTDNVIQDFSVGDESARPTDPSIKPFRPLISKLRVVLRDNNPDRNYHFRPPAWEHMRDGMTHHFGYIWEDIELLCFLELGVFAWNSVSPLTSFTLVRLAENDKYPVIMTAAALAINAVALNWVADEFDYSIGGKSLTIEKSSKYQAMADYFNQQFDKIAENKRTARHIGGVVQRSRSTLISGGSIPRLSARSIRFALSYVTPWI